MVLMTWRLAVCGILTSALVVSVAAASQWKVLFDGQPFPRIWGTNPLPDRALAGDGAFFSQSSPEIKELPFWSWPSSNVTIPFTQNVSAVRILGGWPYVNKVPQPQYDIVSRAANGSLVYHWDLLDQRLAPYLAAGIVPSPIVLDNIPFCFVHPPYVNTTYGQSGPPDNVTEFAQFVGDMVTHLVRTHGADTVSRWRFRMGTEGDGPRLGPSWETNADVDVYLDLYRAVAKAIKKALPTAVVGPSNMAGVSKSSLFKYFYSSLKTQNIPIDYFAMSHYSVAQPSKSGIWPAASMVEAVEVMKYFRSLTSSADAPIEAHEFGWASWENSPDDHTSQQPGVFGAAWRVAVWGPMLEAGLSSAFHWGSGFDPTLHGPQQLLVGQGWVLAMAESLVGTRVSTFSQDYKSKHGYSNTVSALQGESATRTAVLTTLYSAGLTERSEHTFTLTVAKPPSVAFESLVVTQRQLNVTSSYLDVCQADLADRDMTKWNDSTVDLVSRMATPDGLAWAKTQFNRYLAVQTGSMTPFTVPADNVVRVSDSSVSITLTLHTPTVVLLELN